MALLVSPGVLASVRLHTVFRCRMRLMKIAQQGRSGVVMNSSGFTQCLPVLIYADLQDVGSYVCVYQYRIKSCSVPLTK